MLYELRTYTLKPGTLADMVKAASTVSRDIRGNDYGKLEGYWSTEIGPLNQVLHLWSYRDYDERTRLRAELAKTAGGGAGEARTATRGFRSTSLDDLSRFTDRVRPEYLEAVGSDLERLVPRNFLEAYPIARLMRIPRYLEGLAIRLERARLAPEKDKAKAAQIEPYEFELARLETALRSPKPGPKLGTQYQASPSGSSMPAENRGQGITSPISEDKRRAVDELRWMIEEFKLALFSPEIKTAFPISAVRLARKIAEIEALA
jgi:hypothetical protein